MNIHGLKVGGEEFSISTTHTYRLLLVIVECLLWCYIVVRPQLEIIGDRNIIGTGQLNNIGVNALLFVSKYLAVTLDDLKNGLSDEQMKLMNYTDCLEVVQTS